MTYAGGGWQYNDYTYTMSVPAMMSSPTPVSTLPGPGVMFQWNGHASIGNYWLYVGTGGAGSGNIFSSGITNTWRYVGGLPASGTVNVRLIRLMGDGLWPCGTHLHGWRWRECLEARETYRLPLIFHPVPTILPWSEALQADGARIATGQRKSCCIARTLRCAFIT